MLPTAPLVIVARLRADASTNASVTRESKRNPPRAPDNRRERRVEFRTGLVQRPGLGTMGMPDGTGTPGGGPPGMPGPNPKPGPGKYGLTGKLPVSGGP